MSLYQEAAVLLANDEKLGGSLKARIYAKAGLKHGAPQLFALISEATKWSAVLKEVIERCGILDEEKKAGLHCFAELTPTITLLLVHDHLLSKGGIAANANHPLKLAVLRHKASLNAEFNRVRLNRGFPTVESFRAHINSGTRGDHGRRDSLSNDIEHPRWVRINALHTSLEHQLATTFQHYEKKELLDVLRAPPAKHILCVDEHVPDLIALPPRADLSRTSAYQKGDLILQDKASCFPAYLLGMSSADAHVIDACAAPGNKTTHLAALLAAAHAGAEEPRSHQFKVTAFERNRKRASTLTKMVTLAGAADVVSIRRGADFLACDPAAPDFTNVTCLLLDPSCSGSGIVGRDEAIPLSLPVAGAGTPPAAATTGANGPSSKRGKKRKRSQHAGAESPAVSEPEIVARLAALSTFHLKLLMHAMKFPNAKRIAYSTCSVHAEENEEVVLKALEAKEVRERGWRVLKRKEQAEGMRKWHVRGDLGIGVEALGDAGRSAVVGRSEVIEACLRCEKGTKDGTMGFFAVAFVRDPGGAEVTMQDGSDEPSDDEESWQGFSD
ncbi:S-adenosyl-L-methionine-dependent methyltransferase [Lineolata rhizophorae]|uniref:S-adenosyl-L-methionine-dependent methyltransferase n=1 Tax=Lineolata rhizophorae TaxID=578093 RepID=A0A6A6PD72_9PEZI|nr:S-adenosyl-L-methionine-dependent methyltransferase [Lineolata rhizophorae]